MSTVLEIDDRWVNVDFPKEEKYVAGAINPSNFLFGDYAEYGDTLRILTEKEINAAIERIAAENNGLEWLVAMILNQLQEGSCTANAFAGGHMVKQGWEFGLENIIPVSAMSLYKRIADSASGGSSPSDGFDELMSRGILPLDTEANRTRFGPHVMPNTGFNLPMPTNWEQTSKKFTLAEGYTIKSILPLMTALVNRDPVIVGRQGHAICYLTPLIYKGNWGVLYVNSWGRWGMGAGQLEYGFGIDTYSQIKQAADWAYALRSVRSPYYALAA